MRQVRLGQTGPMVGAVGFGCMSFGGMYGATDIETSHAALARALDLGVTHLDTAKIYGPHISEEVIGAFLKANPSARQQFSIATKGGIRTQPVREFDNSPEYLTECLEGSLQRLGVDHVDLYYIHRRDQRIPIEDVVGTLTRFIEQGKIGAIGFSEIAPASLARAHGVHPIAAVQSEYSLWTRQPELGMLQMCEKLGTTFVSFSPVGRGMIVDTPPNPATFDKSDFRAHNPRFAEPAYSANNAKIDLFRDYAKTMGVSTSTLAIAWTFAKAPTSVSIPGTRTADHLAQDAAAADLMLTTQQVAEIEAILPAGFAEGARYSEAQRPGVEDYC